MSIAPPESAVFLCLELAGTLMTPEEFDAVEEYDENYCYELINGVLVVTSLRMAEEMDPNEELGCLLRNYHEQHPDSVFDKTLPQQYVRTGTSCRLADRVIWIGLGRVPNRRLDPPTIVVEFVSASRRDRQRDYVAKRKEYMEIGIPEYWIIDRFRRLMTVVRHRATEPEEMVIRESETYRTPLLPGFEVPLARLLVRADYWQSLGK